MGNFIDKIKSFYDIELLNLKTLTKNI